MKKILNKAKKGFTIVELVIVIGVIAILSAILIPTFINLNGKANAAALQNDLSATYATYVADAADGKYGDPDAEGAKTLVLYEQKNIIIKGGDTYYKRDEKGTWIDSGLSSTNAGYVISPDTEYVVGNYSVWHILP